MSAPRLYMTNDNLFHHLQQFIFTQILVVQLFPPFSAFVCLGMIDKCACTLVQILISRFRAIIKPTAHRHKCIHACAFAGQIKQSISSRRPVKVLSFLCLCLVFLFVCSFACEAKVSICNLSSILPQGHLSLRASGEYVPCPPTLTASSSGRILSNLEQRFFNVFKLFLTRYSIVNTIIIQSVFLHFANAQPYAYIHLNSRDKSRHTTILNNNNFEFTTHFSIDLRSSSVASGT